MWPLQVPRAPELWRSRSRFASLVCANGGVKAESAARTLYVIERLVVPAQPLGGAGIRVQELEWRPECWPASDSSASAMSRVQWETQGMRRRSQREA